MNDILREIEGHKRETNEKILEIGNDLVNAEADI